MNSSLEVAVPNNAGLIDLARLHEVCEGDRATMQELLELFCDQTAGQLVELGIAIEVGAATEIERLAHTCTGASANCGATGLTPLFRELCQMARTGSFSAIPAVFAKVTEEFDRVRDFVARLRNRTD